MLCFLYAVFMKSTCTYYATTAFTEYFNHNIDTYIFKAIPPNLQINIQVNAASFCNTRSIKMHHQLKHRTLKYGLTKTGSLQNSVCLRNPFVIRPS